MSGPKVVRIVTREEVVALCQQHLARLDAAVAAWTMIGRRNDTLTEADIAVVETHREQLHKMLAAEAFVDLQKKVPEEIAFLEADTEARLVAAIGRATEERTRQRRRARAARMLLAELKAGRIEVPVTLAQAIEALSKRGLRREQLRPTVRRCLRASSRSRTTHVCIGAHARHHRKAGRRRPHDTSDRMEIREPQEG